MHTRNTNLATGYIIGLATYRHAHDAQIAEAACLGVVALFPERRFPPCVSVVVVSAMGMMSPTWKWRPLGSIAQRLAPSSASLAGRSKDGTSASVMPLSIYTSKHNYFNLLTL